MREVMVGVVVAFGCGPTPGAPARDDTSTGDEVSTMAGSGSGSAAATTLAGEAGSAVADANGDPSSDASDASSDASGEPPVPNLDLGGRQHACGDGVLAVEVCFEPQVLLDRRSDVVSAAGDLDGDAFPDVVVGSVVGDKGLFVVEVLPALGQRRFAEPVVSIWDGSPVVRLELVDLDGDGALDLVGNDPYLPGLWLAAGDGALGFSLPVPLTLPSGAQSWVAGDLDYDGVAELVVSLSVDATDIAVVSALDITAPSFVVHGVGVHVRQMTAGDVGLGDATMDLLVDGYVGRQWQLQVLDGALLGRAPWLVAVLEDDGIYQAHLADATGDRLADVLAFHYSQMKVHPRTGGAEFGEPWIERVPIGDSTIEKIVTGRFVSGDALDIAAVANSGVSVRAIADGGWAYGDTPPIQAPRASVADLDEDGLDDLLAPSFDRSEALVLWNRP